MLLSVSCFTIKHKRCSNQQSSIKSFKNLFTCIVLKFILFYSSRKTDPKFCLYILLNKVYGKVHIGV